MDICEIAKRIATKAHSDVNQTRKYSGLPYIVHPRAVVKLLGKYVTDNEIIAAAWLHDTIEDTNISYEDILEKTNKRVADLVFELTELSKEDYPNQEERKLLEIQRLKQISPEAQTVKYADILDNVIDIVDADPEKAKSYLSMKIKALENMKNGNSDLREFVIERAKKELERAI